MTKKYENPGQPTKYSPVIANKICTLISTNPKGLRTLIRENNLPDRQTIYNWLNTYPEFFDQYMRAKEQQAHVLADETLDIAAEVPIYLDKDGNERIDNGILGKSKLQIEACRWSASLLAPRWYGDARVREPQNTVVDDDCKKRYQEMDEKNRKEY